MNLEPWAFIKRRFGRDAFTGLPLSILLLIFFILLATFVGITESIVTSAPIVGLDVSFSHLIFLQRSVSLTNIFYAITNIASWIPISILSVITLAYLYLKKELAYLYAFVLTIIGNEISVYYIKIFINRDRPGDLD